MCYLPLAEQASHFQLTLLDRKTNFFLLFSCLVHMNIHVLFCPVSILLPLAYKQQMWHFPSLVFPLQQIGAWELLHCLKDHIHKKASVGEKKIGSDFCLNFVVRAEWMCGSSYAHELSKPRRKRWGTGQGRALCFRGTMGQRLHTQPASACTYFLFAVLLGLSKCGGPEGQGRAQVSLKLARGVKNNKAFTGRMVTSRSSGWFLLFKSSCKPWNGCMKPTKMSTVLETTAIRETLASGKKETGNLLVIDVKILSSQGSTVTTGNRHKLLQGKFHVD